MQEKEIHSTVLQQLKNIVARTISSGYTAQHLDRQFLFLPPDVSASFDLFEFAASIVVHCFISQTNRVAAAHEHRPVAAPTPPRLPLVPGHHFQQYHGQRLWHVIRRHIRRRRRRGRAAQERGA